MKAKYCIVPDKNKFFAFLAEQSLTEAELLRARLIQPEKILMDIEAAVWQIEYKAVAPVTETLLAAVADKLTAAFNLAKVELQQINILEAEVKTEAVETENKKLDSIERVICTKRAIIVLIVQSIIVGVLLIFKWYVISKCIILGGIALCCSMIFGSGLDSTKKAAVSNSFSKFLIIF